MELDNSGFFIIIVDDEKRKVIVEHYNYVKDKKLVKTGRLNQTFEGTSAEELCMEIINEGIISKLDHASYLGIELEKAELALKNGVEYTQDEELKLR
ncbi:MAG: DUF4346 domain-containing protein [Candidatus Aenigmatarchaeota archaeon]